MESPSDPQIEAWFPNLKRDGYEVTSPENPGYNCIAWAAGNSDSWWQAITAPGYYWPDNVPWDGRVESVAEVFKQLEFEECSGDTLEAGYEKVAVYGQNGEYEHAARQLPDGKWTSKLGFYKDIQHSTLQGLIGTEYGSIVKILRKAVPSIAGK